MARNTSFRDYILEDVLRDIKGLSSKKLFSGWGIYKNGKIFGFVTDGELYLKANKENLKIFKDKGSHQFSFERENRTVSLGYWSIPEEYLDNAEEISKLIP